MAKRPTPSQRRIIEALLMGLEPAIRDAFLTAIQRATDGIDVTALIEALDARDIDRAVGLVRIDAAALFPLQEAVRGGYIAGGASVAAGLPKTIAGSFGFNGRHPRAEAWVASVGADLIQGIADDTLDMTRKVIVRGLQENIGTRAIARSLTGSRIGGRRQGGFLGLTSEIADSVISGRAKLMSGDPALMREYLSLKLRDRRFDGMIKKAIKEGRAIKGRDLDRIIDAHRAKALGYRGRVIARNEAFTAQAAGRDEAMRQVLERDDVSTVTVRWQHNLSENARPDHVDMSGTVITIGETFNFPDAAMKHPHDPAGGAKHSVGCRCIAVYRVELE
jgi:hypothetical protein